MSPRNATTHEHPVDPERVEQARRRVLPADEAARLASLLSLMADPVRSRILYALDLVDELCVGDLALVLGTSEDSVSYGLRILRTAGLVQTRKAGRVVYYRLATDFPEPLLEHCLRQLVILSRAVLQNLAWGAGYNILAIPLAAGVLAWAGVTLSPAVGAVLMSLSTIIVALNAQLLRSIDLSIGR